MEELVQQANWNLAVERGSSPEDDDEFDLDLWATTDTAPLAPPVQLRKKRVTIREEGSKMK